jgi:hypothetical protein
MLNIVRLIPSRLREFFSPITVRFMDTDGLMATMEMMELIANKPWLERNDNTDAIAKRMQILIGRELLRRGVRFWSEW